MTDRAIQDEWPKSGTFCWGCGKNNPHGLQIQSFWDDEETVATFIPKDHHLAFPGILNGGIIATIIDCHATGTANAFVHKTSGDDHLIHVTASLAVKFLKPTPLDKPVTLRARVLETDGSKTIVICDLYSGETVCATAEIRTVGVDPDKFVRHKPPKFDE